MPPVFSIRSILSPCKPKHYAFRTQLLGLSALYDSLFMLCSMSQDQPDDDGQLHTLGLLEQLRAECQSLWGASSNAYFRVDGLLRELANPNLHDIPTNLPCRVETWDRHDAHIRWVISASSTISIGHAALDVAIANFPNERFMLRNGALVIRRHPPDPPS
jgi:hypothetical protein